MQDLYSLYGELASNPYQRLGIEDPFFYYKVDFTGFFLPAQWNPSSKKNAW